MKKPKFEFHSSWKSNLDIPDFDPINDYRNSQESMGGYRFPILDSLAGDYSVTIYPIPDNVTELKEMIAEIKQSNVTLAYVDTNKLVVVRSTNNLSSLGLKIWTTDANSKTIKRAKTIVRPFRVYTHRPQLTVMVQEGGPELDGAGVVSKRLFEEALANVQLGYWNPVQRASSIRYLGNQLINNCRFAGEMVNWETGEIMEVFGKGNFLVADTGVDGPDIITSPDNLKHEVTGSGQAWALFEPQGAKDAWEDQQTHVNQSFLMSVPELRERMKDEAHHAFEDLAAGRLMSSVRDLAKSDFHRDYAWDDARFFKEMRWNANSLALHGLSYLISPWLTERLGNSWVSSLAVDDARKLRVRIPNAVRCQVVSAALIDMAGLNMDVEPGTLRWCPEYKVLVANDEDWVKIIIPTHGGCDLDDFFVARWRMDEDERKILITRSPNNRGEFSFWNYVEGDWHPKHKNRKGEEITFPPLTLKKRPKQILQAIEDGDVIYMDLPSQIAPPDTGEMRQYGRKDCIRDLGAAMQITGGYGQYELAVRAANSLSPTKMDRFQIRSEDAVDAFTQGGTPEDRQFILDDRKRILDNIVATGKAVDLCLAGRLGVRDIPMTEDGPISKMKSVIAAEVTKYEQKLSRLTFSLETPPWLIEIGENKLTGYATSKLRESRRAMYGADQAAMGLEHEERIRIIRAAQESVFEPFFTQYDDRALHAQFMMAFWYACRILPTTSGKFTDQPVFGTDLFPRLLDALVFYGIAMKPYVDERGQIRREGRVTYDGEQVWTVTCKTCDRSGQTNYLGLVRFWRGNAQCKECRG